MVAIEGNEDSKVGVYSDTTKLDLLIEHINALVKSVELVIAGDGSNQSQTQTVVHKTEGMGAWGAAAVTACMFTFLGLILFAMWAIPEIHDLKAWKDIHGNRINALEARQTK